MNDGTEDRVYGIDRVHVKAEACRNFGMMMNGAVDVWLYRMLWPSPESEHIGNRYDLKLHIGQSVNAVPDLWVPHNQEDIAPTEPTFRLSPQNARFLMDAMWRAGIRPSEMPETAGAISAMQAHIKDLKDAHGDFKTLAFKVTEAR